jgi:hypothetical protein
MDENPYQSPGPTKNIEPPSSYWPKFDILSLIFQVALIVISAFILVKWIRL